MNLFFFPGKGWTRNRGGPARSRHTQEVSLAELSLRLNKAAYAAGLRRWHTDPVDPDFTLRLAWKCAQMFSLLCVNFANADRRMQTESLDLTDMQPEWWASNFYGDGKMNNMNQRAGDPWDPPTQSISFARNSTSNTRLQGNPVW